MRFSIRKLPVILFYCRSVPFFRNSFNLALSKKTFLDINWLFVINKISTKTFSKKLPLKLLLRAWQLQKNEKIYEKLAHCCKHNVSMVSFPLLTYMCSLEVTCTLLELQQVTFCKESKSIHFPFYPLIADINDNWQLTKKGLLPLTFFSALEGYVCLRWRETTLISLKSSYSVKDFRKNVPPPPSYLSRRSR